VSELLKGQSLFIRPGYQSIFNMKKLVNECNLYFLIRILDILGTLNSGHLLISILFITFMSVLNDNHY